MATQIVGQSTYLRFRLLGGSNSGNFGNKFSKGIGSWSSREQFSIKTYKFQGPELDTSPGNKLVLHFNLKKDQALLLGLSAESKFLGNGRDLGSSHYGRRIAGYGPKSIFLTTGDFKRKDSNALEGAKISTFSISLTDQKTKRRIKLTDLEARKVLGRIEVVSEAKEN